MPDPDVLEAKIFKYQTDLNNLITPYFAKKKEIYDMIGQAIRDAQSDVEKRIFVTEMNDLREQIRLINENDATPGFLVDLALSALLGPIGGHVAGHLAGVLSSKYIKNIAQNRNADLQILKSIMNKGKVHNAFRANRVNPTRFVQSRDTELDKEITKGIIDQVKRATKLAEVEFKKSKEGGRAVAIKEFIDFCTPAGVDIIQAGIPMVSKEFLDEKDTKDSLNSLYNKTDPGINRDIFSILTIIRDEFTKYVRIQTNSDNIFLAVFQFFSNVLYNEEMLQLLILWFNLVKLDLDSTLKDSNIDQQYREYFKVIYWLLYLGNPDGWKDGFKHKFEKADLSKYTINNHGLDFKITVKGVPEDSIIVRGEARKGLDPGIREYVLPELYVPKLVTKIPNELFHHLATNIHYNFREELLYDRAKKIKQKGLGKLRGFGIDAAQPVTKKEMNSNSSFFVANAGDTPYFDTDGLAIILVIDWFKQIDNQVDQNNGIVNMLQTQKNFTGNVNKKFILP